MSRKINQHGLNTIKQWEGLKTDAYQDIAGVWTIGYGHTAAAGEPVPVEGMSITIEEAEALLRHDLTQYEQAVQQNVKVPLNDNQFAALVSFTYNVGISAFKSSTLLRKLNQGNYEAVPAELMKWVYSNGRKVQGLVNRRAAEAGLWVKGDFVASAYVNPSAQKIRIAAAPEVIGPIVAAASGLTGFATGSGPIQWALALTMVGAFAVGIWYFIRHKNEEMA